MSLQLYGKYERKDVHDIFEPYSNFTPQAGTWGLRGIVSVKDSTGDYVLFVTLGASQGSHKFVEEVFDDGTMTWQSQPSNTFDHKFVVDLINHDANVNSLYLFLRTGKGDKYTYMGTLEYVSHDSTREMPVYFMWRMQDFDIAAVLKALPKLVIKNRGTGAVITAKAPATNTPAIGTLTLRATPKRKKLNRKGVSTADFTGKNVDFQGEAKKNSKNGAAGEDLVVQYEKDRLTAAGHADLAAKVVATRNTIGNTAKFDVQSYEVNGNERYIEVKTSTGAANNQIHISEAEVAFSEKYAAQYYLYRVYNYDPSTGNGDLYIEQGPIDRTMLVPDSYVF